MDLGIIGTFLIYGYPCKSDITTVRTTLQFLLGRNVGHDSGVKREDLKEHQPKSTGTIFEITEQKAWYVVLDS